MFIFWLPLRVMNFIPQIIRPSAVKSGPNSKSARRRRTTRVEINPLKVQCDLRRTILRGKATGQWISVTPSTVNGTVLSAQEYRDAFLLRYGRCLEISNLIVMVVARSLVFDMLLSANRRKCDLAIMRSETSGRSGLQGYRPICGSQRTIIHASCPQSRHQNWTKINPQFPATA
jgi:hypothetical protein